MYTLNISRAIKKMSVSEVRDFTCNFLRKTVIIQ